jgi:outer membrane protein assembly factor BamA
MMALAAESPGAAPDTATAAPTENDERLDWFVVPLMGYNSDNGLGFGVRGELAEKKPGYEPFVTAYMAQFYLSLREYHNHLLRYDHLFGEPTGNGGRRLRLTVNAVYRQWTNEGYWGIGNDTARDAAYVGAFADDDPRRWRYTYKLLQPYVHVALRLALDEGVSWVSAVSGKWSATEARPGSLMAEAPPFGAKGGFDVLAATGLVLDTRQPEADPRRGLFGEISLFGAIPTPLGPGKFLGVLLSLRVYQALTSWLVLAGRLMAEWCVGDVPFYEMVLWHGSVPVAGFGSGEAVRGLAFGRFRGPHKFVYNLESRFKLIQIIAFERTFVFQLGLLSDGGMVWGAGSLHRSATFHVSGGAGVRVVYAETFVARFDTAFAPDPIRYADGHVKDDLTYGFYLTFGAAF